ncbi:MAG: two-component system, NtrC family, sensor histidine kinase HydH [Acidobacteriota bacterium]|jgi:signal transduction histidine kinase|nr:two-component system, NtrC family, sensor histidine kinase HydH [Acidobacteriota bacterium]
MKPLKTELQDAETLRDLGSASVQIVHDLKNQLNGLKLYATFLRKRMEKAERPADEQETLAKLISGLERAAADMNVLVRFGRSLELRRQPGIDLARLLQDSADGASVETDGGPFEGDFDPVLLAEALKNITAGALGESVAASDVGSATRIRLSGDSAGAVVEWQDTAGGATPDGEDPFRSLAGAAGLRMALAAKIVRAHGGEVSSEGGRIRARLPLQAS